MYFNWISTASFVALRETREGSKTCYDSIIDNAKLIQHRFITSFVFQLGLFGHSLKKIKVVSTEHKKH